MSSEQVRGISQELIDEPHIEGRRISVLQIHELVEKQDQSPPSAADKYELDVADVYRALLYYHEHPERMQQVRDERAAIRDQARKRASEQRPDDVTPPGNGQ